MEAGGTGQGPSSKLLPRGEHRLGVAGALRVPHVTSLTGLLGQGPTPLPPLSLTAQWPLPHHVDGLRVTGKAEGIATGSGTEVDGHHHREGGLLGGSGLRLLQVQDLELGSSPRARLGGHGSPALSWLRPSPSLVHLLPPACLPGFLSHSRLQAELWRCQLPLR